MNLLIEKLFKEKSINISRKDFEKCLECKLFILK